MSSKDDDTKARIDPRAEPQERPTKEIIPPSPVEIAIAKLSAAVEAGFREARVDGALMRNDISNIKDRVGTIESWKNDHDARASRTSLKVQQASEHDLAHDAQLSQERTAREALATKVDELDTKQDTQLAILARLDKVASNPLVKTLAAMLATALITWLASHGVHAP